MEVPGILSLPGELITMILDYTSYVDLVRFGMSCKMAHDLVKESHSVWKKKYRLMVHSDIMAVKDGPFNWFEEFKRYVKLKNSIIKYIQDMPAVHYYSNVNRVSKEDLKDFFKVALADKSSLGETIYILQEFIRKGNFYLNNNWVIKPYTLTTIYYAKIVLQFIFHMYLALIWGKIQIENPNVTLDITPIYALNFFMQWIDPTNIHSIKEVDKNLSILKEIVRDDMRKRYPSKVKEDTILDRENTPCVLTVDEIINSISTVIYKQRYITLMAHTNIDTLDIVQVLKNHCGCQISIGAIYQHVGWSFGLNCYLIAFPNHFLLELDKKGDETVYKISLDTGECRPKGHCPFTQTFCPTKRNTFSPTELLKYTSLEFLTTMRELRSWHSFNAQCLLDFLHHNGESSPHSDNVRDMIELRKMPKIQHKLDYFNLHPDLLSPLRQFLISENPTGHKKRNIIPRSRNNNVKFAVGMICYHKNYNYVCVIYRWDNSCFDTRFNPLEIRTLRYGLKQPFYLVVTMDQNKRYVPQENLIAYDRPHRLYHIEDIIARDFSYFNGFAYVPNEEKAKEYPDDLAISNVSKCHHEILTGSS